MNSTSVSELVFTSLASGKTADEFAKDLYIKELAATRIARGVSLYQATDEQKLQAANIAVEARKARIFFTSVEAD